MRKIWLVVAVYYCLQGCDFLCELSLGCHEKEIPRDEPFKAILQTEKISKEVGELFSVDISLEDEDGKPVKITEDISLSGKYRRYLFVTGKGQQLEQLLRVEEPADSNFRVGWREGGIFLPSQPPPRRNEGKVIDNGKTVRFENLFHLEKTSATLVVDRYHKGKPVTDDSIPFEIVDNTGVTVDFALSHADSMVVAKITEGDTNRDYLLYRILSLDDAVYYAEVVKKITLDAEGKGAVIFPVKQLDRSCQKSFTVLLKASDGDNSRVVHREVDISPCLVSEDNGTIKATDEGSLTFTERSYSSCSSADAKTISWSYAYRSDYTKLSEGGTLERVNPNARTVDLGTIADYDSSACYLVVVWSACLGEVDSRPTRGRVGNGC